MRDTTMLGMFCFWGAILVCASAIVIIGGNWKEPTPYTITLFDADGNVFNRYLRGTNVRIYRGKSSTKVSFTDGKASRQLIVPSDWLITKTKEVPQ